MVGNKVHQRLFSSSFSHLRSVKILLIGDFVLDVYTKGRVERISPEAPVPVLHVQEEHALPGGAGNVALNLQALGADVGIIGRLGDDTSGESLINLLKDRGLETKGLMRQTGVVTPLKKRFIADGQQLIRTDYEKSVPLGEEEEKALISYLYEVGKEYELIALSDYGKGLFSKKLLKAIFAFAKSVGIRVVVDPKGKGFQKYGGAYLVKPNAGEAYRAAHLEEGASLDLVAKELFKHVDMEHLLITRSDKGMALFNKDLTREDFPVQKKDVIDVTGAGDTAFSMIAFALANNIPFQDAIPLANIASSIAIEELGCAAVSLSDVANWLLEHHPEMKIFDDDASFFVLEKALQNDKIYLLELEEAEMSLDLFRTIKELNTMKGDGRLIISVCNIKENKEMVELLASMHEIDVVLASNSNEHSPFLTRLKKLDCSIFSHVIA